MFSRLKSFSLRGLDVTWVDVEVSVSPGLPKFEIIGMPDTAIRESRERIFQSIRHFGYSVPPGNITVNLAPAEKQKRGSAFDLPIALGLLKASSQIESSLELGNFLVAGELSLEGRLTRSSGIFNAALAALQDSFGGFLFPADNAGELSSLSLPECGFARNLGEAVLILGGKKMERPLPYESTEGTSSIEDKQEKPLDFARIFGNELAVRAAQIAVTAGMNLLLIGPPGCGKTLILRAMKGLRRPLAEQDRLEVTRIHSAAGLPVDGLLRLPPYREVHSTATLPALLGGGIFPMPGEISLAHKGTLVLDELSEFPRSHIQGLRVPLEEKRIILNRLASP
ncbi:MAG: ATP-binding protein, partial [Spirochaetia bacterium]|nr:ATP-binding protein [Spirochaetia bacterium]